jgi:formylglycine-generating enzyme required for sulfatase activity
MSDDLSDLLARLQSMTPEERARLLTLTTGDAVAGDKVGGDKLSGDKVVEPQGTVNVADDGRLYGPAVGINLGTIIYGRAPIEDERRRLVWYLDSLANKLYRLPLRGIEQRLDQGEGMALPHVYVMLASQSTRELASGKLTTLQPYLQGKTIRAGWQSEFDPDYALPVKAIVSWEYLTHALKDPELYRLSRSVLVTEAVQQHPHLALLGDPGGGKSTFMRHLAWALAQRGLDQGGQAPALFGWPDDARALPLLLPLRTLAGRIVADGAQPAVVAAALSAELDTAYNVRQADALIEQALHSGAALLLFDGLDEVPLERAPGHADRATVLRVVREFVQLYPAARVVLTCRIRAFDEAMRAELGWHTETIAPFTLGQIRHFVPAWYGELVAAGQITTEQADQIGAKLIDAITDPRRARLRAMAENPLLLTMMALVLYNQGELPRDRPQLYERILDLLLGQWDKLREGQSLAEAVGMPAWESRDFLPLLDRLCYEAHRDVTSADGRGRLSRGALYTALIDFFKQARAANPGNAALCCLDYFEQRSGLLAADTGDTYVFAHLTLQEHGAGRFMAVQSDDPTGLMLRQRADDRWREPIMLGAGLLRPAELNTLLTDLIDPEEQNRAKPVERRQRDLILAAEIGADRDWNLLRTRPAIKVDRLQRALRQGLVELLSDQAQPLPVNERIRAGFLLGDLGDPRVPMTLDDWRREVAKAQEGDTSGYFCRVEAGIYTIGSANDDPDADDNEKPQHTVTFDAPFLVARYPVTNAQWQAWIAHSGGKLSNYANDGDLNSPNQPVVGVEWYWCNDFCAWFSQRLGMTVRLPTEQEWEAAARGGDARHYPWGDAWQADRAATEEDQETRGAGYTVPVGCYPAGHAPCGALDMAGNVWEWTASAWRSYPGAAKAFTNDDLRVLRGGSWGDSRNRVRCGARDGGFPDDGDVDYGFRVVVAPQLAQMC